MERMKKAIAAATVAVALLTLGVGPAFAGAPATCENRLLALDNRSYKDID